MPQWSEKSHNDTANSNQIGNTIPNTGTDHFNRVKVSEVITFHTENVNCLMKQPEVKDSTKFFRIHLLNQEQNNSLSPAFFWGDISGHQGRILNCFKFSMRNSFLISHITRSNMNSKSKINKALELVTIPHLLEKEKLTSHLPVTNDKA